MKKFLSMLLALIMVFGLAVPAFAWTVPNIAVTGTYDGENKLQEITATVEWYLGSAECRLVLMTQYLESPNPEPGPSFGDFTNYGNLYGSYSDIEAVEANADFGVISYTEEKHFGYGNTESLTFDLSGITLDPETTYYIYFWTVTGGCIYPDFLVAAIKTEDGVVKYSPVKDGCRNTYESNNFQKIESTPDSDPTPDPDPDPETYTVTFVANGEVIETQEVEHGKDAVMPEVPEVFLNTGKWDHNGKNITSDLTITAEYSLIFDVEDVVDFVTEIADDEETEEPEEEAEANPNTGAPVFAPIAVLAAAAVLLKKRG